MRASSPLRIEMENRFALRIFSELLRLRYVLLAVLANHLPDFMVLNPGAGTHLRELRSAAANCVRNRSAANIHAPITNRRGRTFSVNDVGCSLTVLLCIFVTSHKAHRASFSFNCKQNRYFPACCFHIFKDTTVSHLVPRSWPTYTIVYRPTL